MNNPFVMLAFLSLFHIIGAIAVGSALRNIWRVIRTGEPFGTFRFVFFVLWGSLFGCIPFGSGLDPELPSWFLGAQVLIWAIPFFAALLLGRAAIDWAKPLMNIKVGLMIFGGIFMLSGILGGWATFKNGEVGGAVIITLIFGAMGAVIFLMGFLKLLKKP